MKSLQLAIGAMALGLTPASAMAAEVFHFDESDPGSFNTNRSVGSAPLGRLTVDAAVTITQIGILADLNGDSDMQFLIFDADTGANLFTSTIQSFIDDGLAYNWSNALSFTFNPGTVYAVGATSSTGGQYAVDQVANEVGDFNFLTGNQNANGPFGASGINLTLNCCDVATAFRTSMAGAVPEPGTWLLMILGFGAIGASMRRSKKPQVTFDFV
jgi:hypothetical protein